MKEKFKKYFEDKEVAKLRKQNGSKGGRPPKPEHERKDVTISYKTTERKRQETIEKANQLGLTLSNFVRHAVEEIQLPDPERNKVLISYRTNFKWLSNFIKIGIWDKETKLKFLAALTEIIKGIENELKNDR